MVKKILLGPRPVPRGGAQYLALVFGFLLAAALTPAARAHPIRTSYAEADFRPETQKLEIALRIYPDDLETALTARVGHPVTLAHTPPPTFDLALLAYLRATFLLRAADGTAPELHLLGRELKDDAQHLWVYFYCTLPGGPSGARLAHRFLRDVFPDQLNALRLGQKGQTLLFLNDAEKELAPVPAKP